MLSLDAEQTRNLMRDTLPEPTRLRYEREYGPVISPGKDFELLRIYRCEHCWRLTPYGNGGGGCSELPLTNEENSYLECCCDDCWCRITSTIADIYRRHGLC